MQAGDVVTLKSGGPEMTVTDVHSGGEVSCKWFDVGSNGYAGDPRVAKFPSIALKKVSANQ